MCLCRNKPGQSINKVNMNMSVLARSSKCPELKFILVDFLCFHIDCKRAKSSANDCSFTHNRLQGHGVIIYLFEKADQQQ